MAELQLKIKSNIDEIEKRLQELARDRNMKLKVHLAGDKGVASLRAALEAAERSARDTGKAINNIGKGSQTSGTAALEKNLQNVSKIYKDIESAQGKIITARTKFEKMGAGGDKDIISIPDDIKSKIAQLNELEQKLNALRAKGGATGSSLTDKDLFDFKGYQSEINLLTKELDNAKKRIDEGLISTRAQTNSIRAFDKIGNRLTEYFNRYETGIRKNTQLYNRWLTLMNKSQTGGFASINEANREFAAFRTEARMAGIEVEGFGTKLEKTFGTRVRSALSGYGVFALEDAVRDIVQNSVAVDTAMTELRKVTDATETEYAQFMEDAGSRAKEIGAGLAETINATADYARLGFDIPEASTLADSALIYLNVGDDVENIDEATSHLISTMQGFGIAADDSMQIVDKFNNVSNKYAVSAGDIGEMVMRSAASMAAAGNTLDQTKYCLGV